MLKFDDLGIVGTGVGIRSLCNGCKKILLLHPHAVLMISKNMDFTSSGIRAHGGVRRFVPLFCPERFPAGLTLVLQRDFLLTYDHLDQSHGGAGVGQ